MKIFIEKRALKADGTRTLRLIYDHGYTIKSNGSRQRKREHEVLDLFVYEKPKTPTQRQHNKEQTTSTSNHSIWLSARKHLRFYCGKHDLSFDELDKDWLGGF
ncbi:phage integrase SAM-like domain-containing protein [Vibrio sp. M250220]|uniref:phage integrase SAM-like domain-containing protein n=1 Tax=unclassified Vibrio TaxID=2614977 RepID=UPI002F629333